MFSPKSLLECGQETKRWIFELRMPEHFPVIPEMRLQVPDNVAERNYAIRRHGLVSR